MKAIDLDELTDEATRLLAMNPGETQVPERFIEINNLLARSEKFSLYTNVAINSDPALPMAMIITGGDRGITASTLTCLIALAFECGRLYGRSEIVRETMGEGE